MQVVEVCAVVTRHLGLPEGWLLAVPSKVRQDCCTVHGDQAAELESPQLASQISRWATKVCKRFAADICGLNSPHSDAA